VWPGLSVPRIYRSATDDGELSHRLFIAYDRESTSVYATSNARVTLSHNSNCDLAAIVENVRLVKQVSQVRTVGLATNVITTGILTGSAKLWNNYRRKTPTQQPSATPFDFTGGIIQQARGKRYRATLFDPRNSHAFEFCYHRDTFTLRAQRSPPTQGRKMEPKSAGWIADS
jgi:hypothetical protein